MKVKFINSMGGIMFVDESRVAEYKEMGFKPVSTPKPKTTAEKKSTKKKEEK